MQRSLRYKLGISSSLSYISPALFLSCPLYLSLFNFLFYTTTYITSKEDVSVHVLRSVELSIVLLILLLVSVYVSFYLRIRCDCPKVEHYILLASTFSQKNLDAITHEFFSYRLALIFRKKIPSRFLYLNPSTFVLILYPNSYDQISKSLNPVISQ